MKNQGLHREAFTLIELLAAMALMVVVAASLYSTLHTAFRAKRSAESAFVPAAGAAAAIEVIKQDIAAALPPAGILSGDFQGVDGRDGASADSVILYTTNTYAGADKATGGQLKVEFVLIDDAENEDSGILVRRVTTNLLSPRTVDADEQVLCRDVHSLNIRYFDGFDWLDEWDSTAHDDTLPQAVEVTIEIENQSQDAAATIAARRFVQSFALPCAVAGQQDTGSQT